MTEPSPGFRYVHATDLRLDAPIRCAQAEVRAELARRARQAIVALADLCLAEGAQALVLDGMVFDPERLTLSGEELLVRQLQRLAQAGVTIVVPGQAVHGARGASLRWPRERLLVAEPPPAALPELPGWGSRPARDPAAPPLFGRHHGEDGPCGARLVVDEGRGATQCTLHEVARLRWTTLELRPSLAIAPGTSAAGRRELLDTALAAFDASREDAAPVSAADPPAQEGGAGLAWMLRLRLSGPAPDADELSDPDVLVELGAELVAARRGAGLLHADVVAEGLHRPVDGAASHRGEPDLLGLALAVADELAGDAALLERLASPVSGDASELLPALPEAVAEALLARSAP